MATVVTNNFRNAQMGNPSGSSTQIDFDGDDIRCSLIDQTDSGALDATDGTYADVNTGTPVAEGAAMASKTVGSVAAGVFDSTADYTFSAVTGDAADYLVLYKYNTDGGERDRRGDLGFGDNGPARDTERWRHHGSVERIGDRPNLIVPLP